MPRLKCPIFIKISTLLLVVMFTAKSNTSYAQRGVNDTITAYAVVFNGDTMEAKTLSTVDVYSKYANSNSPRAAQWTRLRNAVYVTYPYAKKAGAIMNDINAKLEGVSDKSDRKNYIKSREKELKKEFTDPLTNLSIYQGKVLMKLINRETGNNCYEIIKEYKGGLTARFYQTVAFFFSSNLKQPYDAQGDDRDIERFVQEVCRVNGYPYSPNPRMMQPGN
jgi:Domain of unknown function (DUF4294)